MENIVIERQGINVEALDETLRSTLGEQFRGLSASRGQVVLHMEDGIDQAGISQAMDLVNTHDPTVLTAKQQMEADMESQRVQYAAELDVDAPENQSADPVVNTILERLVWLEREIRDLRGL